MTEDPYRNPETGSRCFPTCVVTILAGVDGYLRSGGDVQIYE